MGGGASLGAAADPSTPSDGAAAAVGGGGVVDNSSPVVEDCNGLTATTQMVHSENGTPVTVKVVKTAAGNRAKRSSIWQVIHEFKPSIKGKNVICSACIHLMSWVSTSGTTGTRIFNFVVYIIGCVELSFCRSCCGLVSM